MRRIREIMHETCRDRRWLKLCCCLEYFVCGGRPLFLFNPTLQDMDSVETLRALCAEQELSAVALVEFLTDVRTMSLLNNGFDRTSRSSNPMLRMSMTFGSAQCNRLFEMFSDLLAMRHGKT